MSFDGPEKTRRNSPGVALLSLIDHATRILRSKSARVVLATGIQALAAAAFAVLTARWLGPADRGVVVVFLTVSSVLALVGSFGVGTGGRVLLASPEGMAKGSYWATARRLWFLHWLTIGLPGMTLMWLSDGLPIAVVGVAFALHASGTLWASLQRDYLHGLGAHTTAVLGDVCAPTVQILGLVALQQFGTVDLRAVCALLVAGVLTQIGMQTLRLRCMHNLSMARIPIREFIRYSVPALVGTLGQAFVVRGDRLILGAIAGAASVGIYGAASTLAESLWLVALGVSPVLLRRASAGGFAAVRRLRAWCLGAAVLLALVVAALASPFTTIVLGSAYEDAVPLTYALLASAVAMSSYLLDAAVLNGCRRLNDVGRISVIGSAVLALLALLLVGSLGSWGAAIATMVAYSAMAVMARMRVRALGTGSV